MMNKYQRKERERKNKVDQSIYEKMFNFRKNPSNANKNEVILKSIRWIKILKRSTKPSIDTGWGSKHPHRLVMI